MIIKAMFFVFVEKIEKHKCYSITDLRGGARFALHHRSGATATVEIHAPLSNLNLASCECTNFVLISKFRKHQNKPEKRLLWRNRRASRLKSKRK